MDLLFHPSRSPIRLREPPKDHSNIQTLDWEIVKQRQCWAADTNRELETTCKPLAWFPVFQMFHAWSQCSTRSIIHQLSSPYFPACMASSKISFRFRLLEFHGWRQSKHPHKANGPLMVPEMLMQAWHGFTSGVPQAREHINMHWQLASFVHVFSPGIDPVPSESPELTPLLIDKRDEVRLSSCSRGP